MKKGIIAVVLAALFFTIPSNSFAWGKTGHELVGKLAFHFLDDSTRLKVQKYLGNLSFEEAANWMDDSRSNSYFDYMRTWHYMDLEKGEKFDNTSHERNMITVLFSAITELRQMDKMKRKEIKRNLLLIFHLVGDLHQPLHCGYASDKGGNTIMVNAQNFASNLHSAWDTQIIETEGISMENCLAVYDSLLKNQVDSIKQIVVLRWYNQSRSYLDTVYSFKNDFLDRQYIEFSKVIIKHQLLKAGLRLASILSEMFKTTPAVKNENALDADSSIFHPYYAVLYNNQAASF